MNAKDIAQEFSIFGLKYTRRIFDKFDREALTKLKRKYSYVHISSFVDFEMPGFERVPKKTPIIDLTKTLEDILKNFRRDSRAGVRKSELEADLKFMVPDADTRSSYAFYKSVKSNDRVLLDIKSEFNNCVFFNAYYKNQLLVSMSFYGDDNILRSKHIASLRKQVGMARLVANASRKLIWEVCKYAKGSNFKILDLGIINFAEPDKEGIAAFKNSFGGDIVNVYIFRYETPVFKIIRKILNLYGRNIS